MATIDYGNLMHRAMRGLIQQVLTRVAKEGLPGDHHFFITFDTTHPDVAIADWLRERYPDEMTIVVQHWFDNLDVRDDGFSITLNFGNNPEPLVVPYDALKTFVDPSVEFGLRFEQHAEDLDDEDEEDEDLAASLEDLMSETGELVDKTPSQSGSGEVVQLDRFRK